MSKASLKKELSHLDHSQLVEVILNAYSASKEAKDYFEFFLNPDADALLDKKIDMIAKELTRSKRGYSKARISVIRSAIKDFGAYGVGDEYVYKLMYRTIRMIVGMERYYYYPDALNNGVLKLATEYMVLANKLECVAEALEQLQTLETEDIGRKGYRTKVLTAAREALNEITVLKPTKK